MRILISGASVSGPVLAYWLTRYGFDVTVVERAPEPRKVGGGHAVDLFRPAMDISEAMGVLPRIEETATGTERMRVYAGGRRPVDLDLTKVFQAASDRHVEIMRDDLSEIYYDATRDDAEYVFGDSITKITDDGDVEFERGAPRRFDVVVGADGLHSNVRGLTFGDEAAYTDFLGMYLGVFSVPREMAEEVTYIMHLGVGRVAGTYAARNHADARGGFFFRTDRELDYHHRDVPRQKELLRAEFAGMHPDVDELLARMDDTPAFYFDSITQLRMDTWSRGRVTLVGDAGYCPGPAVGGSTSLAVVGAYTLAGELAEAKGDHVRAFAAYEREMGEPVRLSRAFAKGAAKTLVPNSRPGIWALVNGARLISALPPGISRGLAKLNSKGVRMHDSMRVRAYAAP
ncbi:MAG TPA: FAD-dependent monooxygenase [Streptosporangiaceae bacterium]|jgi:2-polyprenyl-6-methoxyphenol hydroxylase-like FAD-dependent oxidoreductase